MYTDRPDDGEAAPPRNPTMVGDSQRSITMESLRNFAIGNIEDVLNTRFIERNMQVL
jgi:hypothetical protein